MKTNLLNIKGEKVKDITLPNCFSETIRKHLVQKIIEAKKVKQPYAPSPVAGNQASASGRLIHRRKVWNSQYGRGMSRVPRKTMSRKGSQFQWVAATAPNTRKGRRAHPPKILSMIGLPSINKKELKLALASVLSATGKGTLVSKRYERLNGKKLENLPFVVESKLITLKTKELLQSLRLILGDQLFEIAIQKKSVRNGIGKLRGRKYKTTAGMLLIIGNDEKIKTTAFDVQKVNKLGVNDLANGGVGRLTVYTEAAIKDLGEKFK